MDLAVTKLVADVAKIASVLAMQVAANDEQAANGHRFKLMDAAHIFTPLPPIEYVIEGVLPRGGLAILGGYSSSGKSWLALDAALSIATGSKWLGRFATQLGTATILDKESGEYESRRRLQRLYRAKGLETAEAPKLELCCFPDTHFGDPNFERRVRELANGRSLLLFDTLAAFSPGVDENAAAMGEGLNKLQVIAKDTNCAILVVAHEKKLGVHGTEIDERERLRGSSAIIGAIDSAFSVQYRKGVPLRISQIKARGGTAIPDFTATIIDLLGGTAVVTGEVPSQQETIEDRFEGLCRRIHAIIAKKPECSGRHVRAVAGARNTDVAAALERLLEDGRIVNLGTERNPRFRSKAQES